MGNKSKGYGKTPTGKRTVTDRDKSISKTVSRATSASRGRLDYKKVALELAALIAEGAGSGRTSSDKDKKTGYKRGKKVKGKK